MKFRERNVINTMDDMEKTSEDAQAILAKIEQIRKKGSDQIKELLDTHNTCAIKVKFRIDRIMSKAKEMCDLCILEHRDPSPTNQFNVRLVRLQFSLSDALQQRFLPSYFQDNQKRCVFNELHASERDIEQLELMIEECNGDNESSSAGEQR